MSLIISKGANRLDLNPGTSLGFERSSPIYFGDRDPDVIPGQVTYTITLPNTSHNRRVLGRPAQLDNPQPMLTEDGWQVFHAGHLHATGRLEVRNAGLEQDISITLVAGMGGNLTELKENNLGAFFRGEETTVGTESQDVYNHAAATITTPGDFNWLFPTINIADDSDYQPESDDEGAPEVATRYSFLNLYESGRFAKASGIQFEASSVTQPIIEYSSMAPQPRLHWILEKMLAAVGFSLTGVFESDPDATELKNLLLATNATQDLQLGIGSSEPSTGQVLAEMELDPVIRPSRLLPMIKGNELLKKVCNRFCWTPFIDEQFRRIRLLANRDLINDPTFIDWTDKVDPRHQNRREDYNLPQAFTTPATDDDSFVEKYPYEVPTDARVTIFETYSELRTAPVFDIVNDPTNVFYVVDLNEYCFYRGGNSTRRIFQSLGRDFGFINRSQSPVYSSGATTLLTRTGFSRGTHKWLTGAGLWWWPGWHLDPVSPLTPDADLTTECVLLFYRGMQPNREGRTYPLAIAGRYNAEREAVGELSLLWNGAGGLLQKWWEDWIHNLRPVTFNAPKLTSGDIANLDLSRKYRIGNHQYFIRKLSTTLEDDGGVGVTTLDLLKIA
jgi:hypothetical protein